MKSFSPISLLNARSHTLYCNNSSFLGSLGDDGSIGPSFIADSARFTGLVTVCFTKAVGEFRMISADLGANLELNDSVFDDGRSRYIVPFYALSIDSIKIRGRINIRGSNILGGITCLRASVSQEIYVHKTNIYCKNFHNGKMAISLNLASASVAGSLFMYESRIVGQIDLSSANFRSIEDDKESWPSRGFLSLNGCRYGIFIGGQVDVHERLRWLDLQFNNPGSDIFWPQPYEQLASVLRETGHSEDARTVMIEKERRQRGAQRARMASYFWKTAYWLRDTFLGQTVRYGWRPLRAVWWLGALLILGLVIFWSAEGAGALKPNAVVVLRAAEWAQCAEDGARRAASDETQLACFKRQPQAAAYPQFNAFIYSADTLLPIVSFEMQEFWIPDESIPYGRWARRYLWVHITFGWALSLLAVAGFSGLIKSN